MTALEIIKRIAELLAAVAPIVANLNPHEDALPHLPAAAKAQIADLHNTVNP